MGSRLVKYVGQGAWSGRSTSKRNESDEKIEERYLNSQLLNGTVPSPRTLALIFHFSISYLVFSFVLPSVLGFWGCKSCDNKGTLVIMTSMKQDNMSVCM
jgi:hypothetical protein